MTYKIRNMSDLNNRIWKVKVEGQEEIEVKAYKFDVEGNSIVFKESIGKNSMSGYRNVSAFPCNKTIVKKNR